MADPIVQDVNAATTTEEAPATQPQLPPTIESEPSVAPEINGAADGAPAEPMPADAAEPVAADNLPAAEAPAPDTENSEAPGDVAEAMPASEPAAEATPATGDDFAAGIGTEALEASPVAEPIADGSDTASDAPSEPAAEPAAIEAQPDTEAEAAPLAPGADATDSGGELSPLPMSDVGASPVEGGESTLPATESQSPSEADASKGDVELPYNATGMAQLGTAGIDGAGAPVEHPAPATIPAPIDPTTGNQLGEDDHKAVTGGEDYQEILTQKGPEETDATNGVVAEHPAPAKTPTPIDPTSGLPLSDEDHKAVTGGLEKGTEVEVPVAPVNTEDGKAVEGGAKAGATADEGIPSAFDAGSDAGSVASLLGDEDGEDEENLNEGTLDEIKSFIEQKFNSVFHKLKHLEHEMHEALRSKKRR